MVENGPKGAGAQRGTSGSPAKTMTLKYKAYSQQDDPLAGTKVRGWAVNIQLLQVMIP